jgi:hypothetical protein
VHPPQSQSECALGLVRGDSARRLLAVCVDGGMYLGARAFLEIDQRGHFLAHEQYRQPKSHKDYGKYITLDLTEEACL